MRRVLLVHDIQRMLLFLCLSSRYNDAHALSPWHFSFGKRVAFPWSKLKETARSLFSK